MLDLHDLSVSPALLAIRWWLAEVGKSGVAEVNRLRNPDAKGVEKMN